MTEWKVYARGTLYVENGTQKGKGDVCKTSNKPETPQNSLRTLRNTPEHPPDWKKPRSTLTYKN